jgi:hypothetical protein
MAKEVVGHQLGQTRRAGLSRLPLAGETISAWRIANEIVFAWRIAGETVSARHVCGNG